MKTVLPSWNLPANALPFRTLNPSEVIRKQNAKAVDPDFLDDLVEDARQMLKITQGRYPGGVTVPGADEADKVLDAVALTRGLVEDDTVPAIFSGAFYLHDVSDDAVNRGVMVRPEILERLPDGTFHLVEATSSTKANKEHYVPLAAKMHVLQKLGVPVSKASIVLVNSSYVYSGGEPDMAQLLRMEDCTEKLADADITAQAERFVEATKDLLARGVANDDVIPDVKVPLHDISRLIKARQHYTKTRKIMAYAKEHGITDIRDLPENLPELSDLQRRQIRALKTGEPYVDGEGLRAVLAKIAFPAYHMDFETTQEIIPPFPGTSPYQQIPYQYSVHVMGQNGDVIGDNLVFLHDGEGDPRRGFVEKLIRDVGADRGGTGSIIVCYRHFETSRLEEIVEAFPEYKDAVANILSRLVDIQEIVRDHVYFAEFDASFSLKKIFPGLVRNPKTRYEDLKIHNGAMASQNIREMISPRTSSERRKEIFDALILYCGLDTFSMVEIYRALVKLAAGVDIAATA